MADRKKSEDDVRKAAEQVRGSVTEAVGKLTGDKEGQAKGAAQKGRTKPPPAKTPPRSQT